jgi:hypothetical protein
MKAINWLVDKYQALPKWLRFTLYYVTMPLWVIQVTIIVGIAVGVLWLTDVVTDAYEDFE